MQKTLYEWVLVMNKGDDIVLSENQYEVYKEGWKDGQMFFNGVMVNPSYVVQAYRRPAEEILRKYPCRKCYRTGVDGENTCKECGGTGFKV